MQVIRDATWKYLLDDAVKMYRIKIPNDKCYRLADSTWKLKERQRLINIERERRKIVVLDKPPEVNTREKHIYQKLCKATTMSGKCCSFKAVCGDYCRKHNSKLSKSEIIPSIEDISKQLDEIKINM